MQDHTDDCLPQYLCGECLHKLEAAYAFVLQARQAQEQLLLQLCKGSQRQCLEEMPIDIRMQDIKNETDVDIESEPNKKTQIESLLEDVGEIEEPEISAVSGPALKWQPESDSDNTKAAVDE